MPGPTWVTIDDPEDARLDLYRHLTDAAARRSIESEHGVFLAEGTTVIRRLIQSPYPLRSVLLLPERVAALAPDLEGLDVVAFVARRGVLEEVAGFDVHRGALAVAERRPLPAVGEVMRDAVALCVLEGLSDQENLGAIARSASALGIDGLLLDPTSADPLYRRTVRVSMGEILFLPWTRARPWPAALEEVRAAGFIVLALTPAPGAEDLDGVLAEVPGPIAMLLGREGPGLTPAALAAADRRVRIPLRAGVDSLNVGHAAAIVFHALARTHERRADRA